jgi:peptidoglycan/LPS O-acetylase OafA/YrhL
LVLPLICTAQNYWAAANVGLYYVFTHVLIKFQCISVGCFASLICFKYPGIIPRISRYKLVLNILALALIFCLGFNFFYTLTAVYVNLVVSLLIAYIILTNITPSADPVFNLLNFGPLTYIGVLSYSIYMWQQIFTMHQPWLGRFKESDSILLNLLALSIIAYVSYNYYERPFLTLKQRYKKILL